MTEANAVPEAAAVVEEMKEAVDDNGATGTVDQPETAETARPGEGMEGAQPEEQPEPVVGEDGQTAIPGTEQEEPEEDPKEPRSKGDIAADFRVAIFNGDIKAINEDWDKGRTLKMVISSTDRDRLQDGMRKFSATDDLMFRVLPRQRPLLKEWEPEEFGSKVPNFGVEMVERLEQKSCEGFVGWERMDRTELCEAMKEVLEDMDMIASDNSESMEENRTAFDKILLKKAVDMANFAFFMWWNAKQDIAGRANG